MEASRERNGNNHQDTSETGKVTVKMGSESSFTRMEISMKACGALTTDMGKALTGGMKVES